MSTLSPAPRLTIELVPSTMWGKNVRSSVDIEQWDILRRSIAAAARERCEIRGRAAASRKPLHCHEVFAYDAVSGVQRLEALRAICADCHAVTHIGLAARQGRYDSALRHLARINRWSLTAAQGYVDRSMALWQERSRREWTLNLSYADALLQRIGGEATDTP